MSIAGKRIVICGGGLGGMALSSFLVQDCAAKGLVAPTITIIERSPTPQDKDTSSKHSIGIRDDTGGVQALRALGIEDELRSLRPICRNLFVARHDGKSIRKLFVKDQESIPDFRIGRNVLFHVLHRRMPKEVKILWGQTCTKISQKNEVVTIHLQDGTVLEADLLVAADGNRSKVREILCPNEKLQFKGASGVLGVSRVVPPFMERSLGVLIGSKGFVFLANQGEGEVLWIASAPSDAPLSGRHITMMASEAEKSQTKEDSKRPEELRALAHKIGNEYPDAYHELVDKSAPESMRVFNFYDKPPHRSIGRVVFVGDSTHPVTPLSGNGANLALVDAQVLSQVLTSNEDMLQAIKMYDDDMVKRSTASIVQGSRMVKLAFSTNFFVRTLKYGILETLGFVARNFQAVKRAVLFLFLSAVVGIFVKLYQRIF